MTLRTGIDTNILVRAITGDDPAQLALAAEFLASLGPDHYGQVARETLVEMVWVLRRVYGYGRDDIIKAVEGLLDAEFIDIEDHDRVEAALLMYRSAGADFADSMIAAANQEAGCEKTVTFDRKFARLDRVELLE